MTSEQYIEHVIANEGQILIDIGITNGMIGGVHPPAENSEYGELHIYGLDWKFMTEVAYKPTT